MKNAALIAIIMLSILFSCGKSGKEKGETEEQVSITPKASSQINFSDFAESVYEIQTFDGNRILEKGQCFQVTSTTLVAPFSLFKNANRAIIQPLNGGSKIELAAYYSYDRINNIILLKTDELESAPLKLFGGKKVKGIKTIILGKKRNNTQPLMTGTCLQEKIIQGRKLFDISNNLRKSSVGAPVFVSNGSVLGMAFTEYVMYERKNFVVPALEIIDAINKRGEGKALENIGSPNAKRNAALKSLTLVTDFGNIDISLYNETPAYRDNFIQLTEEGFYDSLLIHRVIRDFGIQMGAADTRHAQPDDIVGWKGPGYTIPANIVAGLYHKRGAIGSPRKPDDKNQRRRSDGSQFYIVTGRKYLEEELDEIEQENGLVFSQEQREVYTSLGGAPHLDGSYTVFGEVISGLNVADRISLLPVKGDFRPISEIRLKKVIIND